MKKTVLLFVCGILFIICPVKKTYADLQSDLNNVTGGQHCRVVWLQGSSSRFHGGTLKGYDSDEDKKITLLEAHDTYKRPLLHNGGNSVILTIDDKIYTCAYRENAQPSYIVDGQATDIWKNPSTGKEWVVVHETNLGQDKKEGPISRYLIDDPSQKVELQTSKTEPESWYQISGDGEIAIAFLPWSTCYYITDGAYASNEKTQISNGCWSSVTRDNSHYWFHLICCPHDEIKVFHNDDYIANVAFDPTPLPSGTKDDEFYHPKFASHGNRIIVITGGYHSNSSSDDAEIYVGRFSSDYRSFEDWARITQNDNIPDYFPDAWVGIESAGDPTLSYVSLTPPDTTIALGEEVALRVAFLDQFGEPIEVQDGVSYTVSGGGELVSRTDSGGVFQSHDTSGTFTIIAQAQDVTGSSRITVVDPSHIKVNCGGNDPSVPGWESDAEYVVDGESGEPYFFSSIADTSGVPMAAPPAVYKTVRHYNHRYSFDIPNGEYRLRFHFYDEHEDNRAMDYIVEGETIIDDMNIVHEAGGTGKALVTEFTVTVSDGNGMQIAAEKDQGNDVFEAGIEIQAKDTSSSHQQKIELQSFDKTAYTVGDTMIIRWTATGVEGVRIQISPNNGLAWDYITKEGSIKTEDAQWGSFKWVVSAYVETTSVISDQVAIKVTDYFNEDIKDVSPNLLTIRNTSGDVLHASPNTSNSLRIRVRQKDSKCLMIEDPVARRIPSFDILTPQGKIVHQTTHRVVSPYVVRLESASIYLMRMHHAQNDRYVRKIFLAPE